MLDQSFSAENFKTILDIENRKGLHLEDKLSITKVKDINNAIKDCNSKLRIALKARDYSLISVLNNEKKQLRQQREETLEEELAAIGQKIASKGFQVDLKKVQIPGEKPIYIAPNTPESYFAIKQVQRNIYRLFGIKQSNRFSIISQIKSLLSDAFPKYVIRTDIKEFYESIEHGQLSNKIEGDNLLSPFSKSIIRKILGDYKTKSGSQKGIPRGIGISAYLSELFMRDIDKRIKELPGLTYYARYVDDIILIFTPFPQEVNRNYLEEVKEIVEKATELKLNPAKTSVFDLTTDQPLKTFDYLGYKFEFGGNKPVRTYFTTKKFDKYKDRLQKAFDHYVNLSKVREKEARKLLVKRIRFLTGNTRLINNKSNIIIGIYYSNSQLTEAQDLIRLDDTLRTLIDTKISSPRLKSRLLKYKFKEGFDDRRFSPFTPSELAEIMRIWNNKF